MPIRIIEATDEKNQPGILADGDRYITRDQLTEAQSNFRKYYRADYDGADATTSFIDVFEVDWPTLKNVIESDCIGQDGITVNNLALRFIHRYDHANGAWYLTMQCCKMQNEREQDPLGFICDVVATNIFYKLIDAKTTINTDSPIGHFASDYFTRFHNNFGIPGRLSDIDGANASYVGNLVLPWKKEILELADDNGVATPAAGDVVRLKFMSCSFEADPGGIYAKVNWPHGLVLCMNKNGRDLLRNNDSVISYTNLGANYGTMCPPHPNIYIIT